ncbi:phosphate ABC transporter permease subunit PstC [Oharaeibacter diazotrophicus]|uniref:Phosphate transport system permease protein n=1 Tax=Oharaeibacter diazotrophicus TaxID=1920512 RepID=A0A4R6RIB2_9HYPH|nr:phosphate ABC transporter permease subunit PstC [Oharaeibacter diazotrophicus]TDP86239.1 phosphate ABC transporter membrane protein 1 (PhoT family) [Oharaeibacter diazotrophicus]BBE71819.1 phosphate transport system permease protein PstC [Pleomorphomonas sp. SM30]GLS78584.1 phosphate transport system permease protein [Oharaeibacter diazotrophicus]
MGSFWLLVVVAALAAIGLVAGRIRVGTLAKSSGTPPHSRPAYYGSYLAIWTALPAVVLLVVLAIVRPIIVDTAVRQQLPEAATADGANLSLTMGVIEEVSRGLKVLSTEELDNLKLGLVAARPLFASKGIALASDVPPYMIAAAQTRNSVDGTLGVILETAVIALAGFGFVFAFLKIRPRLRARGSVETVILGVLIAASSVAILTTIGIVASMLFEALHFFSQVSPASFFFGTVWDPRFAAAGSGGSQGQFGLLPLAWGTLYISALALLVAVPIGLFAAIYMAEYASSTVRSVAKPLLEILAGIPTIVYGFFALVTVGPAIRDFLAIPLGLGQSGNNVVTAGLVMGIMIIPYVSSLSDDIITAVPRALRDGSLGLGATKSETIKRVVLPAALPGIVGAILLAASRAIGETMIVVLAAGVAARISANPFEEMTTITVKIVNQLTGDLEFTSPQTLVAFALGITLFTVTLGLNIIALHIVRKYREQYE